MLSSRTSPYPGPLPTAPVPCTRWVPPLPGSPAAPSPERRNPGPHMETRACGCTVRGGTRTGTQACSVGTLVSLLCVSFSMCQSQSGSGLVPWPGCISDVRICPQCYPRVSSPSHEDARTDGTSTLHRVTATRHSEHNRKENRMRAVPSSYLPTPPHPWGESPIAQ